MNKGTVMYGYAWVCCFFAGFFNYIIRDYYLFIIGLICEFILLIGTYIRWFSPHDEIKETDKK
jgi:hypothetical protein